MVGPGPDELVEIEMLGRRREARNGHQDSAPAAEEEETRSKRKAESSWLDLFGKLWQPRRNKYSRRKTPKKKNKFATTADLYSGEYVCSLV